MNQALQFTSFINVTTAIFVAISLLGLNDVFKTCSIFSILKFLPGAYLNMVVVGKVSTNNN
jgi:hypothetical protein